MSRRGWVIVGSGAGWLTLLGALIGSSGLVVLGASLTALSVLNAWDWGDRS